MNTIDSATVREAMVKQQLVARGVRDPLVLNAMQKVPRERFLPAYLRESAYDDSPLPISGNQTISQPYIVAFMTEALSLKGGEKVLEIGTGSGYAAAVLGEIANEVFTIERIKLLAAQATKVLRELNYTNVHVLVGDGSRGYPEQAPFDAIIVAAGAPSVPKSLKLQLEIGGRLVIPVGKTNRSQQLVLVTRVNETTFDSRNIASVRFVPLIGKEGWRTNNKNEGAPS